MELSLEDYNGLQGIDHHNDSVDLHSVRYDDQLRVQEVEYGPIDDPNYSSPMHLEVMYQSEVDDLVFKPWTNPFEVDPITLDWMVACCPDQFDADDLEYIKQHGAFNEEAGYETIMLGAGGARCKQCGSPESRLFNTSQSDDGQILTMLCNECISKKCDRSRRRNPRPKETQDMWGFAGYYIWLNNQRLAKGLEPFYVEPTKYKYGTNDQCTKPYMQG